jgi:hypothetical protein
MHHLKYYSNGIHVAATKPFPRVQKKSRPLTWSNCGPSLWQNTSWTSSEERCAWVQSSWPNSFHLLRRNLATVTEANHELKFASGRREHLRYIAVFPQNAFMWMNRLNCKYILSSMCLNIMYFFVGGMLVALHCILLYCSDAKFALGCTCFMKER